MRLPPQRLHACPRVPTCQRPATATGFQRSEPDSAARLVRGAWHAPSARRPTASGCKRGWPLNNQDRLDRSAAPLNTFLEFGTVACGGRTTPVISLPGSLACCLGAGHDGYAKARGSEVFTVSNLMAMRAIRPALLRRPWRWPAPSCRALPDTSSCSRHRQRYSVSAPRSWRGRCWCRPTEISPAESRRAADPAVFPASSMTEPRHWSAGLPPQRCIRWSTGCQAAELARCFRSW